MRNFVIANFNLTEASTEAESAPSRNSSETTQEFSNLSLSDYNLIDSFFASVNCTQLDKGNNTNFDLQELLRVYKPKPAEAENTLSLSDIPDFTQCVTFGTLSKSGAKLYNVYTMIIQFLVPVIMMLLCYVIIIIKLTIKHRRQLKGQSNISAGSQVSNAK